MILYVISVGLSVTMGLMGFINLAHGVFAMAGGYIFSTVMARLGMPFPVALLMAFIAVALGSIVLERLLYSRLYTAGELTQVLFTIGLIYASAAIARMVYGTLAVPIVLPEYLKGQVHFLSRDFPAYRVFLIVFSMLIILGLWFGVERTRWGAMVRAAVDNRGMAQSVGINTSVLFMLTFALGSGLAGLGGALGADILPVDWGYPFEHLAYFLIVVAVGGSGNILGGLYASLILGITDVVGKYYLPQAGAFFIYAVMVLTLIFRPQGLFGRGATK